MADGDASKQVSGETETDEINVNLVKQEAENGSGDHQYQLGKYYLKLADSNINRVENVNLAIKWLVKSSKQGNEPATEQLKKCVQNGTEIDEEIAPDVRWCINTSALEKQIRHASSRLFQKLNTTHKNTISSDEYMAAIKSLPGQKQQKLLLAAGKKIGSEITETEFVKTLSKKIQGTLTLTEDEVESTSEAYKTATVTEKLLKYPKETAGVVVDNVLEYLSKEGMKWVVSLIPTNQIYLLFLLFVYSYITPKFIFFIIPLFIFYLSYASLIISSMQMFYKRRKQSDAANLAGLLKEYDMNIDIEKTESQYSWNSLTPYFVFFGNLPVGIASFSLANKAYVPVSELCVIALVMAVFCFIGLGDSHDKITFLTLFANLLASMPVFLENFPNIPVIKWFIMFITKPLFRIDLTYGFFVNISIPSIAYLIIPVFFIKMAMVKSWQGTYRILIPHLVCYFWWSIMTSFFPYTTWFGLARASLGYLLMPVLLPLCLFGLVIFIGFTLFKLIQTELFGKLLVTFALLMIPIALTQTKSIFGKSADKKYAKIKKIVMVLFSVFAVLPLLFVRLPSLKPEAPPVLSWNEFHELCIPKAEHNVANLQMRCENYSGTKISWQGEVVKTQITKVENVANSVLKNLPNFVADPLKCIYGSKFPVCNETTSSKEDYMFCKSMEKLGKNCHVGQHTTFTFSLIVKIDNKVDLNIEAGNEFKDIILALSPKLPVAFNATLKDGLGTGAPSLKLVSLKSLDQDFFVMMAVEEDEGFYYRAIHEAISFTFNFIWFPMMEYVVE